MKSPKLIIFDLDGTLLDTSPGIISAIKQTIKYFNLPYKTEETLLKFIGPPIEYSFEREYGLKQECLTEVSSYFRNIYSGKTLMQAIPYDGIYETLDFLKENSISVAVATNKRERYAIPLLKNFHFDKYSECLLGTDNNGVLKKHDLITRCMHFYNITGKNDIWMVGDTVHDKDAADKCGIKFIGVTYGFGFREKEPQGRFIDSPVELKKIIENYED